MRKFRDVSESINIAIPLMHVFLFDPCRSNPHCRRAELTCYLRHLEAKTEANSSMDLPAHPCRK